MTDHRLTHRRDGVGDRGQQPVGTDVDLVVVGPEGVRDQVGVGVLVAGFSCRRIESDAEGGQVGLALLGEQGDHE